MMKNGVLDVDIERDVEAILALIYEYMDKTYITNLQEHVNHYRKGYEKDRSKESELIKALIPFVPEGKKETLEQFSDLFRYEYILKRAVPTALGVRGENKEEMLNQLVVKIILYKLLLHIENR